jgi:deoxyadenosine/deoxycytidine kinase
LNSLLQLSNTVYFSNGSVEYDFSPESFRIKCLDKEDIENFGFIFQKESEDVSIFIKEFFTASEGYWPVVPVEQRYQLELFKDNKIVICDRYIDSSLAYQGFARGIGFEDIYDINMFATQGILPDLTVYFDIDAKRGLERINRDKNREKNRLDLEKIQFHNKVCEGYNQLIKKFPRRIKAIDAKLDPEQVYNQLEKIIYAKIKGMKK